MARINSLFNEGSETVTVWFAADKEEDRRLLRKMISVFAEEINARIAVDNWELKDIVEAGADMMAFLEERQRKAEEDEDEAI